LGYKCIEFWGTKYGHWSQTMGKTQKKTTAFAYLRTSSAANVGDDKDSEPRQMTAIEGYAKRAGIDLIDSYYDASVKGADPIETRPGFAAMLEAIEANGTQTIIVETSNRFARDLLVQEVGFAMLQKRGITVIAADSPAAFLDDTPTARLIRQILGAISEFEKSMLVAKLRGARERKRRSGVRVEGRKPISETRPETIELARKLARKPKGKAAPSLRDISRMLAKRGHVTGNGTAYAPTAVKLMLR
jgi:DNA invertase Pin-like site-specific DNA recombinase